jgi:hypothetical protein
MSKLPKGRAFSTRYTRKMVWRLERYAEEKQMHVSEVIRNAVDEKLGELKGEEERQYKLYLKDLMQAEKMKKQYPSPPDNIPELENEVNYQEEANQHLMKAMKEHPSWGWDIATLDQWLDAYCPTPNCFGGNDKILYDKNSYRGHCRECRTHLIIPRNAK